MKDKEVKILEDVEALMRSAGITRETMEKLKQYSSGPSCKCENCSCGKKDSDVQDN
jgi:hypothetical protein